VGNADIQSLTYQSKDVSVKSEKKAKQKSNAFQAAKSIPHVNDSTREETSFSSQKSLSKNEVQMNAPMPAMSGNQDDKTNRKSAPQQFQLRKMDADKSPSMDSAMKKYNDKDYANAVALFNQILVNETSNYNAHYYAGLSYFSMDKSDSAILNFDFVLKIKNGEFYEASQWYKALALIKQNKLKSAKKLLNEIVTKGGSYKVQAQNKLEELDRK
jgi:predicted Zn-dependent protease